MQMEDGSNENDFESFLEHNFDSFSESEVVENNSNSAKDLVQSDESDDPEYVQLSKTLNYYLNCTLNHESYFESHTDV